MILFKLLNKTKHVQQLLLVGHAWLPLFDSHSSVPLTSLLIYFYGSFKKYKAVSWMSDALVFSH